MNKLLVGIIFIFLDFSITVGNFQIGLVPDFIGYFLLLKGLEEMSSYSEKFDKIKPITKFMIAFSIVSYAFDLCNFLYGFMAYKIIIVVVSIVAQALMLYIAYRINLCFRDIQETTGKYLYADELISALATVIIFNILLLLTVIIRFLFIIGIVLILIVNVYYILIFYRTRNAFYDSYGGQHKLKTRL